MDLDNAKNTHQRLSSLAVVKFDVKHLQGTGHEKV